MKKKKSNKGLIIFLIVLVVIIGFAVAYVKMSSNNAAIAVQTGSVEKRTITQTVAAIGDIQPETEVKISSETSGEIIYLGVNIGDTVKKGDLLIRIKPDIIETQLEQQKAAAESTKMNIEVRKAELERSKKELERTKELYEKEYASKQELDAATAAYESANSSYLSALSNYEQAKASLKQVQRSAERTTIMAPMDGIVTMLEVEEGEKVVGTEMMQGTEIMRISDLNVMNAVVEVDENDIILVNLGDITQIEVDAISDKVFKGKVVEIGHAAIVSDLGSQDQVTNFEVKIRLLDEEPLLRPGMSCNVEIETETRENVLAVPLQAVTVRNAKMDSNPDLNDSDNFMKKTDDKVKKVERPPSVVFTIKDNIAYKKIVETGISDKGFIEIKSGLDENEKIVTGSFSVVSKELKDSSLVTEEQRNFKKNNFNN